MEYLKDEDYAHIKDTIDEFLGDTVMGNHLFKAIKVYFKRKDRESNKPKEFREELFKKPAVYANGTNERVDKILQGANEALEKFNKKLRRKNATTKGKKKANN